MIIPFSLPPGLVRKCEALEGVLSGAETIGVAYSGGADSAFLAWFAMRVLGRKVHCLLAVSPFLSARERAGAVETVRSLDLPLEEIVFDPLAVASVRENPTDRCYHCKREIMTRVKARAMELGCSVVVDGTHAGDVGGHRPGRRALRELGILSPLAQAGLVKEDIRELSRLANLPTWNKPSQSCLATRVPYGAILTPELLSGVERAEALLLDLGCRQVRVRAHGDMARIEMDAESFRLILDGKNADELVGRIRALGFARVVLDLQGYRSGSWDEGIVNDAV